jgi:hypothetical protein
LPFWTPSLHAGSWQTLPVQMPVVQSLGAAQPSPGSQAGHLPPPSTAGSAPVSVASSQARAGQTAPRQTGRAQTPGSSQASPSSQPSHTDPPQSTSLSSPSPAG